MKCKVEMQRVRLNSQGYDRNGSYWGTGQALYWFVFYNEATKEEQSDFFRAPNRYFAKLELRRRFPALDLRFY